MIERYLEQDLLTFLIDSIVSEKRSIVECAEILYARGHFALEDPSRITQDFYFELALIPGTVEIIRGIGTGFVDFFVVLAFVGFIAHGLEIGLFQFYGIAGGSAYRSRTIADQVIEIVKVLGPVQDLCVFSREPVVVFFLHTSESRAREERTLDIVDRIGRDLICDGVGIVVAFAIILVQFGFHLHAYAIPTYGLCWYSVVIEFAGLGIIDLDLLFIDVGTATHELIYELHYAGASSNLGAFGVGVH